MPCVCHGIVFDWNETKKPTQASAWYVCTYSVIVECWTKQQQKVTRKKNTNDDYDDGSGGGDDGSAKFITIDNKTIY